MRRCTASSQWQAIFEKGCCTLVLLRWEVEFCSAEMSFFVIGLLCMSRKNAFIANQKNSLAESFTNFTQSRFLRTKTSFACAFLCCPQKFPIFTNQKVFFCRKLYEMSSKAAFLCTKSLSFAQTFPYCHPKQSFSALRFPFAPPLTYCLQRMQLFFCCSL